MDKTSLTNEQTEELVDELCVINLIKKLHISFWIGVLGIKKLHISLYMHLKRSVQK